MRRFRVVTYNIAHGRGLNPIQGTTTRRRLRGNLLKIARFLDDLKPDVVALQEIDENSRWAGNFDHLEFLREFGNFPHAIFGINNRREGLLNLSYGNAILSHHPIVEWENIAFGQRKIGEKGFLFAEIAAYGRHVPVANLHLHYRSRRHRLDQVARVFAYLHARQAAGTPHWSLPPVVCGDFNAAGGPHDAPGRLLAEMEHFGGYALHPAGGKTFPSPLPTRALDFVLVPAHCRVLRSEVIPCWLSDHRPVLVDFAID